MKNLVNIGVKTENGLSAYAVTKESTDPKSGEIKKYVMTGAMPTKYDSKAMLTALLNTIRSVDDGDTVEVSGYDYLGKVATNMYAWKENNFTRRNIYEDKEGLHGGQRLAWGDIIREIYDTTQQKHVNIISRTGEPSKETMAYCNREFESYLKKMDEAAKAKTPVTA